MSDASRETEWGPSSALHGYITKVWSQAGEPSDRQVEQWAATAWQQRQAAKATMLATLSKSRIAQLRTGIGAAPTLEQLQAMSEAIALGRTGDRLNYDTAELERTYSAARVQPVLEVQRSLHFAKLINDWGNAHAPKGLRGVSTSVCVANTSVSPPSQYVRVFDPKFQHELTDAQEYGRLRRSGEHFKTQTSVTGTSFRVWGTIASGSRAVSFIGVEAWRDGAVATYFKILGFPEDYMTTLTQVCGPALWTALYGQQLLDVKGAAAATIVITEGERYNFKRHTSVAGYEDSWPYAGDYSLSAHTGPIDISPRSSPDFSGDSSSAAQFMSRVEMSWLKGPSTS